MKSSGDDFRDLLADKFHDLGYRPSISVPGFWMLPEVKPGGFI